MERRKPKQDSGYRWFLYLLAGFLFFLLVYRWVETGPQEIEYDEYTEEEIYNESLK